MKTLIPSAIALALLTSTAGSAVAQGGPGQVDVNLDGLAKAIESRSEPGPRQEPPRSEPPRPAPEAPLPQVERRRDGGEMTAQGEPRWNRDRQPDAPRFEPAPSAPTAFPSQERRRHDDTEPMPQSEDRGRHSDGAVYTPPTARPPVVVPLQPQPQGRPGDRGRPDQGRRPDGGQDDHGADRGRDQHHYDGSDRSWRHDSGSQDRDWQWRDNRDQQWRDQQWRGNDDRRDWGGSRRPYYSQHRYHGPFYRAPNDFYNHDWRYGEYLPLAWWTPNYRINDWWNFGLPRPPFGYQWVRVGDDAILIDRFNGRVIQIVYDMFW